jgi:DNA-directed RNA polymerase subunit L
MRVTILEKDKDKVKLELDDLTLVNLLNENLWKGKIDYSAYSVDHPYLSKPVLVVSSKEPKKSLVNAAEQIIADAQALKKKFQREAKA